MRRGTPPVNPVLDLWSLGHSASQIAAMLGIEGGHKAVTKIVAQARSIGDRRAVLHAAKDGRLIGRAGHMRQPPLANVVPALGPPLCKRGHARTPENVRRTRCRICEREMAKARYARGASA